MFSEEGAHILWSEREHPTSTEDCTRKEHRPCSQQVLTHLPHSETHASCLPRGHVYTAK